MYIFILKLTIHSNVYDCPRKNQSILHLVIFQEILHFKINQNNLLPIAGHLVLAEIHKHTLCISFHTFNLVNG